MLKMPWKMHGKMARKMDAWDTRQYSSIPGSTSATVLYPYHAVAVLYCTGWYSPTPITVYCVPEP
jgi:hypothetical protein